MATTAPFNDTHARQVDEALRQIHDARQLMSKAEQCGVDCQARRAMADELEQYLTAYKTQFMSPRG